MEYKLINPSKISHIEVLKEAEGIKNWYGEYTKRIWRDTKYFKFLWFIETSMISLPSGYWREGSISHWETPFKISENKHYTLLGSVFTYPHITIFCGEKEIHTEYFKTFEELEQHLEENYSSINIKYK